MTASVIHFIIAPYLKKKSIGFEIHPQPSPTVVAGIEFIFMLVFFFSTLKVKFAFLVLQNLSTVIVPRN